MVVHEEPAPVRNMHAPAPRMVDGFNDVALALALLALSLSLDLSLFKFACYAFSLLSFLVML